MNAEIQEIITRLIEIKEETGISQKFKEKAEQVVHLLTADGELCVEKALFHLEELTALEASSYHRTLVWDAMGKLESLKHH